MTTLAAFQNLTGCDPTDIQRRQLDAWGGMRDERTARSLPEQVRLYAQAVENRTGLRVERPEVAFAAELDLRGWEHVQHVLDRSEQYFWSRAIPALTPIWSDHLRAPESDDLRRRLRDAQQRIVAAEHARDEARRERDDAIRKVGDLGREVGRLTQQRDACLARAQDAERQAGPPETDDKADGVRGKLLIAAAGALAIGALVFSGGLG